MTQQHCSTLAFAAVLLFLGPALELVASYDGPPSYDSTAYTECKARPEAALYGGGLLSKAESQRNPIDVNSVFYTPAFILTNLTQATYYCFSSWVRINGNESSAHIRATLKTENTTLDCIGTVLAKTGCWSFLKGGFVLHSPSNFSLLLFQSSDGNDINIDIASASLQPFTEHQWKANQQQIIDTERKRGVIIHVSDLNGKKLQEAKVTLKQVSRDFPFGSAISKFIIGNLPYQKWFVERFNAAVFENELKWYTTEPEQGHLNYTLADKLLEFTRAHQIMVRGHNIFWEDPKYTPKWVQNLTTITDLQAAVSSRIQSLMTKYKEEFIHWDIANENLHFDFYEQRLGPNASISFYQTAHEADPLATLFMNEFNVVESCTDAKSTVDIFIDRVRELERGGAKMDGIGLESHFSVPNPPLMRAMIDKFATLGRPIWLTEVDINSKFDNQTQAKYLEQVLREGFSHPAVNGIMLWTALNSYGCYEMCLTDQSFQNLPAGDVVDRLLKEWQTGDIQGQTDEHGSYSFHGFLGEYTVDVSYGNATATSTFSLCRDHQARHLNIQLAT